MRVWDVKIHKPDDDGQCRIEIRFDREERQPFFVALPPDVIGRFRGARAPGEVRGDAAEHDNQTILDAAADRAAGQFLGQQLLRALLKDRVKNEDYAEQLINTLKGERSEGSRVCLRLDVSEAGPLSDLPWEMMYAEAENIGEYLATSEAFGLLRYRRALGFPPPPSATLPLQMLLVVADPTGKLDTMREVQNVRAAVAALKDAPVELHELLQATRPALAMTINELRPHVIHFIGHGSFDGQTGRLHLHGRDDPAVTDHVDAQGMSTILKNDRPWLIFLNACEGAMDSPKARFGGLAQELLGIGVPFVIAMRRAISDRAAQAFATSFYRDFTAMPLSLAVARARNLLLASDEASFEFATPALYSSLDGDEDADRILIAARATDASEPVATTPAAAESAAVAAANAAAAAAIAAAAAANAAAAAAAAAVSASAPASPPSSRPRRLIVGAIAGSIVAVVAVGSGIWIAGDAVRRAPTSASIEMSPTADMAVDSSASELEAAQPMEQAGMSGGLERADTTGAFVRVRRAPGAARAPSASAAPFRRVHDAAPPVRGIASVFDLVVGEAAAAAGDAAAAAAAAGAEQARIDHAPPPLPPVYNAMLSAPFEAGRMSAGPEGAVMASLAAGITRAGTGCRAFRARYDPLLTSGGRGGADGRALAATARALRGCRRWNAMISAAPAAGAESPVAALAEARWSLRIAALDLAAAGVPANRIEEGVAASEEISAWGQHVALTRAKRPVAPEWQALPAADSNGATLPRKLARGWARVARDTQLVAQVRGWSFAAGQAEPARAFARVSRASARRRDALDLVAAAGTEELRELRPLVEVRFRFAANQPTMLGWGRGALRLGDEARAWLGTYAAAAAVAGTSDRFAGNWRVLIEGHSRRGETAIARRADGLAAAAEAQRALEAAGLARDRIATLSCGGVRQAIIPAASDRSVDLSILPDGVASPDAACGWDRPDQFPTAPAFATGDKSSHPGEG